jgi:hypothetical protein
MSPEKSQSPVVEVARPRNKNSSVLDSTAVAADLARGGAVKFYWRTFLSDPGKIMRGVWDTLLETTRFVFLPRVSVRVGFLGRIWLLARFIQAELSIPGATTTLETIWLTYASASATGNGRDWVEVGCFKGLSTARLSLLCRLYDHHLYVFDTFEGLPGSDDVYQATDGGVDYHFKSGSYAGTEVEVQANVNAFGNPERVTLIKGNAQDTLRKHPLRGGLCFAFLDVDLVESYRSCFRGLGSRIRRGTVIAVHEACYRQVRDLVEDPAFWGDVGCAPPEITYVADVYGIRSCRNLAILKW